MDICHICRGRLSHEIDWCPQCYAPREGRRGWAEPVLQRPSASLPSEDAHPTSLGRKSRLAVTGLALFVNILSLVILLALGSPLGRPGRALLVLLSPVVILSCLVLRDVWRRSDRRNPSPTI